MAKKEYIEREKLNDLLGVFCMSESLYEVLQTIPTADVQPVKHGRWVRESNYRDYDGDICSVYSCPVCSVRSGDTTNYCPNCGAKMDGGE